MTSKDTSSSRKNITSNDGMAENRLQPVIYGILPNQAGDEIDLGELFSKLINQWKLILGITAAGCLLAILWALTLPKVYQPTVTVSIPSSGNIAPIIDINTLLGSNSITAATKTKLESNFSNRQISTINTLFGGNNAIPATPQEVFNRYFNLLRSDKTLVKYINENQYLKKLYPDAEKPASTLVAKLLKGLSIEILEPTPQVKGGYIDDPQRVKISLEINNEPSGVDLLNGYADYVNHQLVADLQNNANKIINGRVKVLSDQVATQRDQYRQNRLLTIEKMQHENAKNIAQLQEQITASLIRAKSDRQTRIADATEALEMAKTLGVINPSTMDVMAKKGMKEGTGGTSITVVDKQSIPLYLYGSKYLTVYIETLNSRESDEIFLSKINELQEQIYVIEHDAELAALKSRKSDDPWIDGLADDLAKIDAIKKLTPDFSNVLTYTMDNPAIVTDESVKPKRKLIVALGFVLSLFVAIFVALIVGAKDRVKQEKTH